MIAAASGKVKIVKTLKKHHNTKTNQPCRRLLDAVTNKYSAVKLQILIIIPLPLTDNIIDDAVPQMDLESIKLSLSGLQFFHYLFLKFI